MTFQPEPQETIFTRIRDAIASASNITNFSDNSPEKAITNDGFAAEIRERQHEALAIQLSNRIDWAGRTITEDDLDDLVENPEVINLDLLNSFVSDDDLDEKVKEYGIARDPGSYATGEVTFEVQDDTVVIEGGAEVATGGNSTSLFTTDREVSPESGEATVTVGITAVERGSGYNVGDGTIDYLPSPPPGVIGVENNSPTTGGQDAETNEELRSRAKSFLVTSSDGGTVGGVKGGLIERFDGLTEDDVIIRQYFEPSTAEGDRQDSPYFEAVVNGGGADSEVNQALDELKPTCIRPYLVRPTEVVVSIDIQVTGSDINTIDVEESIRDYLAGRGIGQNITRDRLTFNILDSGSNINNIERMAIAVIGEAHTYDSSASNHPLYKLNKGDSMASDGSDDGNGIIKVEDDSGVTYTEGTDFEEGVIDGSEPDAIDWGIGGGSPNDSEEFYVDYNITGDLPISDVEETVTGNVNVTVV